MEDTTVSKNVLFGDVLCNTLSFLEWKELIRLRQVSSFWKVAVEETAVEAQVYVKSQRALHGVVQCLPKLKSLKLDQDSDLEQDDESLVLERFSNLQQFWCVHTTPSPLQGYNLSKLLSHWQKLQFLNLHGNEQLEWNLSDLSCLNNLSDLRCINNTCLRGSTQDLLVLQQQHNSPEQTSMMFSNLTILDLAGCVQVTGKLKDFSRMPKLQWLGINRTQISGDLRQDIKPGYFPSLQGMGLSQAVYGADQIQLVQDAPAVMRARLQIMKQSTWESPIFPLLVHLCPDSPDYHERVEQRLYSSERDPPFGIEVIVVGKRWGWRWSNYLGGFCDTHWVDPEPRNCSSYQKEWAEFCKEEVSLFAGFLDPPTPVQYQQLCQERLAL